MNPCQVQITDKSIRDAIGSQRQNSIFAKQKSIPLQEPDWKKQTGLWQESNTDKPKLSQNLSSLAKIGSNRPKVLENRLIEEFKDKESFTREELFHFYRHYEPELKEGTLGWRIYDLKNRNIIKPLKRGLYVISNKPKYKPDISPKLLKVAKQLAERYDEVKHCIWETVWLNEFAQHQISKATLFIEIEKGFEESLYYALKDNLHKERPRIKDVGVYK